VTAEYGHTDELRGARFTGANLQDARFTDAALAGARFRDCDLRNVRILSSWLADVTLSGDIERLVVNDVDVTGYVAAELDRRFPERVRVRELRTAGDYRAAWDTIEGLWSQTVARAERLPEPARHERVGDEWSFVETLRHLVFATDLWARHLILDAPKPYHRLALPPTNYPPEDLPALDVELAARPRYAQVSAVRADRTAQVRQIVDRLTEQELDRTSNGRLPAAWGESPPPVRECLRVIMEEEVEHRRYAERDLAALEAALEPR
jgi:DinB superfamily/Pentapeptide repeats (8 copies)